MIQSQESVSWGLMVGEVDMRNRKLGHMVALHRAVLRPLAEEGYHSQGKLEVGVPLNLAPNSSEKAPWAYSLALSM